MAFQPLGERFEIRSPLAPAEARAAIRTQWRGWFAQAEGPRGWIIGPFLCLWNSAFNRYGPLALARIGADASGGTRITGRAGSDLNGTLFLLVLIAVMLAMVAQMIAEGAGRFALVVGVLASLFPLSLWLANKDRHDDRPLVAFLRRTLADRSERASRRAPSPSPKRPPCRCCSPPLAWNASRPIRRMSAKRCALWRRMGTASWS